jgi:hypothetical protein
VRDVLADLRADGVDGVEDGDVALEEDVCSARVERAVGGLNAGAGGVRAPDEEDCRVQGGSGEGGEGVEADAGGAAYEDGCWERGKGERDIVFCLRVEEGVVLVVFTECR